MVYLALSCTWESVLFVKGPTSSQINVPLVFNRFTTDKSMFEFEHFHVISAMSVTIFRTPGSSCQFHYFSYNGFLLVDTSSVLVGFHFLLAYTFSAKSMHSVL